MKRFLTQTDTSNSTDTVNTRLLHGAGNKTGITGLDAFSLVSPRGTCFCLKRNYNYVREWWYNVLILAYGRHMQADFCELLATLN